MSRNANTHGRFLNGSIQALIGAIVLSTPLTTAAQSSNAQPHCIQVGGTVMTNFLDANTTLGTATGDLSGAVSATLLGDSPGSNGTLVFSVKHHWVTAAGDTILMDVARATSLETQPGSFAILSYPVVITGGTGRFDGANGRLQNIGAVDLDSQRTVFRYEGEVCFPASSR